jgi:SPX domain protein involved in polyphosphate accumulation
VQVACSHGEAGGWREAVLEPTVPPAFRRRTAAVYLDNSSLELYHGRLDKRPNAIALRIRWYGPDDPKDVFVERKTHRETWKV